jgi:hypothetical protein
MPGEDNLELDQGNEPDVQDQGYEETQEPDEVLEGQDARDGEGDDESPDAEGDDAESVDDAPPRRNRAQTRIQSLRTQVETERQHRERMERELAELRAASQQRERQSQQESPEAKAARRALMDPVDIMREDLKESEQRTQGLLQRLEQQNMENADRGHYDSILRDSPTLRKYHQDVEKLRLEAASKGQFIPREALLDIVIGRVARQAATKAGSKPQRQAREQVQRNQSRPAGSRSDTATQRGRQGSTPESRLDGLPI